MQFQLRLYKIKPGLLDEFAENWRTHIVPLRLKQEFTISGAWCNRETSEFVWMVGHDHPDGFAAADTAYYVSPGRANVAWDPTPYLERVELKILDPVRVEQ